MKVIHTFRTFTDKKPVTREIGRKTAIRQFCIECLQSETEPRYCTSKLCALHPFRMGTVDEDYEIVTARREGFSKRAGGDDED